MEAQTFLSLNHLQDLLRTVLGSDAMFSLVNTRVVLKTGIDLNAIDPALNHKTEAIQKVVSALGAMGYTADSLLAVARHKGKV
jgi:enamine deaminase RidA (YjgF/YER057c/UK114 family)